jgi:hypothetical protein
MKSLLLALSLFACAQDTSIRDKVKHAPHYRGDAYYERVYEMIIDKEVTYIRIHKNDTLIKIGKNCWINIKQVDNLTMK